MIETSRRTFMLGLTATGALVALPASSVLAAAAPDALKMRLVALGVPARSAAPLEGFVDMQGCVVVRYGVEAIEDTPPRQAYRSFRPGRHWCEAEFEGLATSDISDAFRLSRPIKCCFRAPGGHPGYFGGEFIITDMIYAEVPA